MGRVLNYIKAHKIGTTVATVVFVILVIFSVLLGIGLTLLKLTDTTIISSRTEIYSICGTSNRYRMTAILYNPCTIPAEALDFTAYIKNENGDVLASTLVPGFQLNHGEVVLDFESDLIIENEDAVTNTLNIWLNNIRVQNLTLEFKVSVKAIGMKFSSTLSDYIVLGEETNSDEESFRMDAITVENNTADNMVLRLDLQVNSSSSEIIVHLPELYLDIYYNNTKVGRAETEATIIQAGWNPLTGRVYLEDKDVESQQKFMNDYINGNETIAVLVGTPNASDCFAQRVLSRISTEVNMTSDQSNNSSSSVGISYVDIQTVDNTIEMRGALNFSFQIYGVIPDVEIVVYDQADNTLVSLDCDISLFPTYDVNVTATLVRHQDIANILSNLTKGNYNVRVVFSGADNRTLNVRSMFTKIMSGIRYDLNFEDLSNGSPNDPFFQFRGVTLLGKDTEGFYRVALDVSLNQQFLTANFPETSGVIRMKNLPVLLVVMSNTTLLPVPTPQRFEFKFKIQNESVLVDGVNGAFEKSILDMQVGGGASSFPYLHAIQRVLQYWNMDVNLNFTQSANGSSSVTGGIMPKVNITVTNTTTNTLTVDLSLNLDLPTDIQILVGNLTGSIVYNTSAVGYFSYFNVRIQPGTNFILVTVTVTANNSRPRLEDLISRYVFGTSPISVTLTGTITGTHFLYGPVPLRYSFVLPKAPGGNDTEVIKCVELTSMDYSVWDIITMNCRLTCNVDAWFHNPLPFPMTLSSLSYMVYFDDPDGAICIGSSCWYSPIQDFFFALVMEPGPLPPIQNPLPITISPQQVGKSVMRMNGFSNELCFRLKDEYDKRQLALDIRSGLASIKIYNFSVSVKFEMLGYRLDPNARPCIEVVGY